MEQVQLESEEWSRLVARLGGEAALARSAREHKAFIRARGIKSATDVLRLSLMYGPGGCSLRVLAAMAASSGVANVSDIAILDRIRQSGDWLEFLCKERLNSLIEAGDVQTAGRPLRIVDGSRIKGPGSRAWRLHLCYDPRLGRIADAVITSTKQGERLDRLAVTPGEIRIADRGFPQPDGIKNTLEAGADLLVRLTWNSLQMTAADGEPIDWLSLFSLASAKGSLDLPVRVRKARGQFEPIAMRLVIIRKMPEAAETARAKVRQANRKDQHHRLDPRTLAGADHIVLLTSLKRGAFPIEVIGSLYRLRWQIELALKRLKSILHIDRLPAKAADLARAWLYAHLLFALLLDDKAAELGALSP
jgi:hypothetical protein